jgi:hypothetical protein
MFIVLLLLRFLYELWRIQVIGWIWSAASYAFFVFILMFVFFIVATAVCWLVAVAFMGARYCVAAATEVMFRIATFQKGAWAALVLIATVVLGIMKLVLAH